MNDDEIIAAVAEYQRTRASYADFGDALKGVLTELANQAQIETESITARAKDPARLAEKLRSKDAYAGLEDVTDRCGVRVVTRYRADIARVREIVEREFGTLEIVDHGSDEISSFGYASQHLIVELDPLRRGTSEWHRFRDLVAEIQIRSILQHAWASISHGLDYKSRAEIPATVRRRLFRVAALLETGDELFDSFRASVEQVKSDYEATAKQGSWRELGLDYDSLTAAWTGLPMAEIVAVAERHGWDRSALPATKPLVGDLADRRLGRLINAASELGIRTLGQLAGEIDEMTRDGQRIGRLAELATANGRRPSAVAADVVVALLLSRDPRGRAAERLRQEGQAGDTPLMRAIEQISREG